MTSGEFGGQGKTFSLNLHIRDKTEISLPQSPLRDNSRDVLYRLLQLDTDDLVGWVIALYVSRDAATPLSEHLCQISDNQTLRKKLLGQQTCKQN